MIEHYFGCTRWDRRINIQCFAYSRPLMYTLLHFMVQPCYSTKSVFDFFLSPRLYSHNNKYVSPVISAAFEINPTPFVWSQYILSSLLLRGWRVTYILRLFLFFFFFFIFSLKIHNRNYHLHVRFYVRSPVKKFSRNFSVNAVCLTILRIALNWVTFFNNTEEFKSLRDRVSPLFLREPIGQFVDGERVKCFAVNDVFTSSRRKSINWLRKFDTIAIRIRFAPHLPFKFKRVKTNFYPRRTTQNFFF